ncbi:peptidoglycan recognition protein [Streptomyces sp. b94]|uniref:peptidoglycan recognition protein family protein n=1 Tax=Streptomyces sp. b94 TaxID=1827634 RepID=UPI001B37D712|nr:peptidoglycan recognition protein [Streptomyces sp. b94]MBQ1098060.1 peptidoglycan recognition protein [Streptomyces sp. b94]
MTGVLIFQGATGGADGPASADTQQEPVKAKAYSQQLLTSKDGSTASLGRHDAKPFSMLGMTWTDPGARITGKVEVRTRDMKSGQWSPWLRLDGNSGQGENGAVRGGTEPAWVGPSDAVEARVNADGQTSAGLPAGLRLDMVDPGTGKVSAMEPAGFTVEESGEPTPSESDPAGQEQDATVEPETPSTQEPPVQPSASEPPAESTTPPPTAPTASPAPSMTASTSPSPTATAPTAPSPTVPSPPPITSRVGWGADESISPEAPGYLPGGKIKAVVVHHTAESNTYTCDQAPAVVRGIYAYHVKQLGWKDVGYNFLVDKCGTIYEGRKGGVDKPVQGAHAYGFNAETTGISVLGTYTDSAPSQAAMTSVARIAAWKLGQYGVNPADTTTLTAGDAGTNYFRKSWTKGAQLSFPVIHGHRDGYNTQCPGDAFYSQLATIRTWAAGPVSGLALKSVTGAGLSGTKYYTKADITVNWSATTPTALIKQNELLIDGKPIATTPGTATSAKAKLAIGTHTVAVRVTHISGKTSTSSAATVIAEATAPSFTTKPALALRTGTVNTTAVPTTLSWKAADSAALKEVRLTAPVAKTYGPATASASHTAPSGTARTWNMTAYDYAGNTASASVIATPVILQETAAIKSGTWTTKSSSSYLGGKSYSSASKNASLTWTFTGRSAAWVVSRASTSGQAYVYVDGTKVATIDLKSSTTKYREALWAKTWSSSTKHTVKIVVVGTAGRPAITTDGLVYIK